MQITSELLNSGIAKTLNSPEKTSSYPTTPSNVSFGGMFQQAMSSLQQTEQDSATKVKGLLSGDGTDIHTALIATQKASLAFDLALAVRNKALGAYQQVMSMQF